MKFRNFKIKILVKKVYFHLKHFLEISEKNSIEITQLDFMIILLIFN